MFRSGEMVAHDFYFCKSRNKRERVKFYFPFSKNDDGN